MPNKLTIALSNLLLPYVYSNPILSTNTENLYQIKSTINNNQYCLTFQASKTMAAYNPTTEIHSGFEIATWEPCIVSDEDFDKDTSPLLSENTQTFIRNTDINGDNIHNSQIRLNQIFTKIIQNDSTGNTEIIEYQKCLTPLPLTKFHTNLHNCDTWTGFEGAGTYLFLVDCNEENVDDGIQPNQQYHYDHKNDLFSSKCSHGLNLGSVEDINGGLKAFLTGSVNTFPSARIAENIILPKKIGKTWNDDNNDSSQEEVGDDNDAVEIVDITQNRKSAINEILEEFLSDINIQKISNHGCWCSKITGLNPDFAGKAVDNLDYLCKEWSMSRRCNTLKGGSCPKNKVAQDSMIPNSLIYDDNYTVKKITAQALSVFNNQDTQAFSEYTCDTTENNNSNCLSDSCKIDVKYAYEISQMLEDLGNNWQFQQEDSNSCHREKVTLEDLTNGISENDDLSGLGENFERICVGTAPNLSISSVEIVN